MHGPVKHVIMCTLGTRGDIAPFVAMAAVLRRSGVRVSILSNSNWEDLVTTAGAEFFAISPPDPSQSGRDDLAFFGSYTLPAYQTSFDFVERAIAAGERPVLVGRSHMLGIEVAASRFGLRHLTVALQPSAVPSCQQPPWPLSRLTMGRTTGIAARALIPAIYRLGERLSPYRKATAAFRQANGSGQPLRFMPPRLPGDLVALLCPEWFAMPAPDWPRNVRSFGFPPVEHEAVDGSMAAIRFLRSGPPAIVGTPGTGVTDITQFAARLIGVARARDMRLLLISPYLSPSDAESDVMTSAYLPLGQVLPHAGLLIHHGGIGTVSAAVAAGCPQLVLAGRFDQPDNGVRVAQLGLGGAILCTDPPISMIGDAVDRICGSSYVAAQVRSAALQVRSVDAIAELAAEVIAL